MPRSKKGKRGSGKPGSLRQEVLQLAAKASLKGVKNGVKVESGASDDELTSDILSHYSSNTQEETEDKLKQCIDNLMDKSAKTRLAALESLRQAFSCKVLYDFLTERRLTVSDCLERSLKKGGGEEQAAAATVFALLCIQLEGGDEAEEGFKLLRPILTTILMDNSASITARQSDLVKSLALLESIFMSSYPNREGVLPTPKPGSPGLHSAALQAWSLLVTLCPPSRLTVLLHLHLPKLQACLQSNDLNYRITVGETIALLVELGRDIDEEFEVDDSEGLCESLKSLATDGNKHRAKNDRRKQRSIFREVLHYIETEDFTEEKIRFGVESVYIDSWSRGESTMPSKKSWSLESDTTYSITLCSETSSALAPPSSWMPLLKEIRSHGLRSIFSTLLPSRPERNRGTK
ncbi:hypothetical protein INR49_021480 [Caranx melampygus]|nr:hypothetical protein INR49_021480 [Caranx melampygus]